MAPGLCSSIRKRRAHQPQAKPNPHLKASPAHPLGSGRPVKTTFVVPKLGWARDQRSCDRRRSAPGQGQPVNLPMAQLTTSGGPAGAVRPPGPARPGRGGPRGRARSARTTRLRPPARCPWEAEQPRTRSTSPRQRPVKAEISGLISAGQKPLAHRLQEQKHATMLPACTSLEDIHQIASQGKASLDPRELHSSTVAASSNTDFASPFASVS